MFKPSHPLHQTELTHLAFSHPNHPQDGRTALHIAAENGFEAIGGQLLDRQAGARICDSDGRLALHLAVLAGHASMVAMLLGPRNKEQSADKLSMLRSVDKVIQWCSCQV